MRDATLLPTPFSIGLSVIQILKTPKYIRRTRNTRKYR